MITATDTNILLDVLIPGASHRASSEAALARAARQGLVIIADPVYAELALVFPNSSALEGFLADTGIRRIPSSPEVLFRAGTAWRTYRTRRPAALVCPECGRAQTVRCESCGRTIRTRQHLVADFLIGAHALIEAGQFLTRDRGFYGSYFPELRLLP